MLESHKDQFYNRLIVQENNEGASDRLAIKNQRYKFFADEFLQCFHKFRFAISTQSSIFQKIIMEC